MLELFNTQIESLSIHQIGNMQKGEPIFLSQQAYLLNDQITSILKEYFLKSFRDKEENYMHFVNETSLEFNEMFGIASEIFSNPSTIHNHQVNYMLPISLILHLIM